MIFDDKKATRWLWLLIAAHVVTWTLYGTIGLRGGVHEDMLEAWVWGKEPQLGYFKHPPVSAWIAGAWFRIMPLSDWSFYLLAALNSALGLYAIWLLAGLFVERSRRRACVLIAMLTPLYGVLALKFNANSVLLAIWPLATWIFVRTIRHRQPLDSIGLGVFGAIALLSKYYSALLLTAFFVVAVLHPARRAYWRSASPYLAGATFLALIAPHLWWLVETNAPTFGYAGTKLGFDLKQTLSWTVVTALAPLLFFAPATALILGIRRDRWQSAWQALRAWDSDPARSRLALLALAPFLLTLGWGLGGVKVSLSYTIPIFFLLPVLIVVVLDKHITSHIERRLVRVAGAVMIAVVLLSPLLGYIRFVTDTRAAIEPREEVAVEMTRLWRAKFGQPLKLVAGSTAFASAVPYYSPDHPSQFIGFSEKHAPWVTPERLAREGLLIICEEWDRWCRDELERRVVGYAATTRKAINRELGFEPLQPQFSRTAYGRQAPGVKLFITMIPPVKDGLR